MRCGEGLYYVTVWAVGLIVWMVPGWYFIHRPGHEWSPVEKQLGHLVFVTLAATGLFLLCGVLIGLDPMKVLPLWLVLLSVVTASGAIILRGTFFLLAFLIAVSALITAVAPSVGPVMFGTAYAVGLFVPAWKYTRRKVP